MIFIYKNKYMQDTAFAYKYTTYERIVEQNKNKNRKQKQNG